MKATIGTAGWAISAEERKNLSAGGTALQRCGTKLRGVGVNSSFHRPHRRSTWERWAASVPADFRFAVKMPKHISHVKRLVRAEARLEQFLAEVSGLGDKISILLLQLPPSLAFDARSVSSFLAAASSNSDTHIVCEPRHESWFSPEVDGFLADRRVARVAADPAKVEEAGIPGGWRGLTYLRLHGSPIIYRSAYGQARLRSYAEKIAADLAAARPTWCMFDNTASSAALSDALQLERLIASS